MGLCVWFIIYIEIAPKSAFQTPKASIILALKRLPSQKQKENQKKKRGRKIVQYFPNRITQSVFSNEISPGVSPGIPAGAAGLGRLSERAAGRQLAGRADGASTQNSLRGLLACKPAGSSKQRRGERNPSAALLGAAKPITSTAGDARASATAAR